jgi:hypothetical protein
MKQHYGQFTETALAESQAGDLRPQNMNDYQSPSATVAAAMALALKSD